MGVEQTMYESDRILQETKQNLQNTYLDILRNPGKYCKNKKYIPTEHDRQVEKIKNDYKATHNRKLGRNDLCSCGSGKKFKNCCLKGEK